MLQYLNLHNLLILIRTLLDIVVIWAVFYYCLKMVRNNSRTVQIFKGIVIIILVRIFSNLIGLTTVSSLVDSIITWGVVCMVVIFQPEIRNILEKLGKASGIFNDFSTLTMNEKERLINELVDACSTMSANKTGALISIERGHSLSDYIKTGTSLNSDVTSALLCSIFQYGTPLHDGAVIIQGTRIACGAAYFPPTSKDLATSYGARHRAAVGISEITDSITIVVSEETGHISIAMDGELVQHSKDSLEAFLRDMLLKTEDDSNADKDDGVISYFIKGKNKKNKKNKKNSKKGTKKSSEEKKDIGLVNIIPSNPTSEKKKSEGSKIVLHYEKPDEEKDPSEQEGSDK